MIIFFQRYKKYLIALGLVIALFVAGHLYLSNVREKSYQSGYEAANSAWVKKGQEYVSIIDQKLEDNKKLNSQLAVISEQKRKLEQQRKNKVTEKQIEYVKTEEASEKGLDEKFIDLYNDSLGE